MSQQVFFHIQFDRFLWLLKTTIINVYPSNLLIAHIHVFIFQAIFLNLAWMDFFFKDFLSIRRTENVLMNRVKEKNRVEKMCYDVFRNRHLKICVIACMEFK